MADDSNALTHVPPTRLTNEAEYEAMCTAFAETERGRWFLSEYAKRNRNADTTMVMGAIARIEAAVARQVPPDTGPAIAAALTQTMGELRERAGHIAAEGDATLQTVRRNAQKMRDVVWTLREWGIDSDLCDELDALTAGIVESSDKAAVQPRRLLALLDEWNRGDTPRLTEAPVQAEVPAQAPAPEATPSEITTPIASSEAAPSADVTLFADVTSSPEVILTPVENPAPIVTQAKPVASSQSLGAALLAQGLIAKPRGGDALAPLRRMSQAEKVAFFT